MTELYKWSDIRAEVVAELGGEEEIAEAHRRNQAYIDGYRLAARRKEGGLSQSEVAGRMGVTKSRVSQIERGEVSTVEVLGRYIGALGGQLQIAAVFGDDTYLLRSAEPEPAAESDAA